MHASEVASVASIMVDVTFKFIFIDGIIFLNLENWCARNPPFFLIG